MSSLSVLDTRRRGATFVDHTVQTIANTPESTGMNFWSINPYIGCEFGCTYCYARYTHEYTVNRKHDAGEIPSDTLSKYRSSKTWDVFEHTIFVKRRASVLAALERDIERIRTRVRKGIACPIAIGTATDPYQPAERIYAITRAILERLIRERGFAIGIVTKSSLIQRDIELLTTLQQQHCLSICISLISNKPRLIKIFESRSPMPHVRLRTLRRLVTAGLNAGLMAAPILPGVTDSVQHIDALVRAVREHGGKFIHPSPLRMYSDLYLSFLPLIRKHFPALYSRYCRAYRSTMSAPSEYVASLLRRFRHIAQQHSVAVEDSLLERWKQDITCTDQLQLWQERDSDLQPAPI